MKTQINYRLKKPLSRNDLLNLDKINTFCNLQIHIKEKLTKWKGKACYSHSDPHMMTFDGE